MKFVFPDLNEHEADIVANFLAQDNIPFKTYQRTTPLYVDCEDEEPYDFMDIFDIVCITDLAHYDFVKKITDKKIKTIRDLDRIYYTKEAKKRVSTRKKHPIETDIIVDILESERIPYKLRAIRQESYFCPSKTLGYDIEIYSDLEHFDYAKTLIQKRISDISRLEVAFDKPSVDRMGNPIMIYPYSQDDFKKAFLRQQGKIQSIMAVKPKKSLLKRFIDWIKNV